MDIFKIIAFSVISLMLVVVLEKVNKEYAIVITLISAIVIFSMIIIKLDSVIALLNQLVEGAGINKNYLTILLKVTGISYIVELTKNICEDAGSSSLATKVEMAGKISVVILTIPIITSVVEMIVDIV